MDADDAGELECHELTRLADIMVAEESLCRQSPVMSCPTISRCLLRCIPVVAVGLCSSCDGPSGGPGPNDTGIAPIAARDAILTLIRKEPTIFIGNPDPERLAALELESTGEGVWHFGAFEIDVRRMTYSAMVGEDGPEPYLYEGRFTMNNGTVIAEHPELTRFHRESE